MIALRKSEERGHANYGWLDTRHTFSFADYYDTRHMHFGALRVINEDFVAPGAGFPTHPHRDMEIVTYILQGALAHRDSMGNGSMIRPGEVQRMSAGTGVTHSEYNASDQEPVHLLQIWIMPEFKGLRPGYEQKEFTAVEKRGRLRVVASPDGREGSVTIHQEALIYATLLEPGESVTHALAPERRAYVHVARGKASVNGEPLAAGDGARISDETAVSIIADASAEVLLFDLN